MNNYRNVMKAISRINKELGIGARHITLSTVGMYVCTWTCLLYSLFTLFNVLCGSIFF